jgi:hypothetical protein
MRHQLTFVFIGCVLLLSVQAASAAPSLDAVTEAVHKNADRRPRLLVDDGTFRRINRSAEHDPVARKMIEDVLADAETILPQPPLERKMIGRRLLDVSRTALHRIATLATAYRLTDDERFLRRAEQEMLAVCAFDDWNPSHFLDVAEMTAGLAIGYDWLYADLAPDVRRRIREAIVDKGLKPSLEGNPGWVSVPNNWNQVCNGGLVAGALAVMDDEPEIAARIVHRAVENVPIAMKASYAPNGTYPEGPGYWSYGTTYNVLAIACLRSALGTDFGLADEPGFDKTAGFFNQAIGPSGLPFNYADCWPRRIGCEPAVYWFATEFDTPWWQQRTDQLLAADREGLRGARFGWLAPLWRAAGMGSGFFSDWEAGFAEKPSSRKRIPTPSSSPPLDFLGVGPKPVAMHRSSWSDPRATYVGVCAGSPGTSHGHMDIGSFIFETGGVRWAIDLGAQDYESLESRGVDLWNTRQDSQRWDVFRLGNLSHNTLVVSSRHQRVAGSAKFIAFSDDRRNPFDVVDMSDVYQGQAGSIVRGLAMPNRSNLVVYDNIDRLAADSSVRWGFVTEADVDIQSPRHAILLQDGQRLAVDVLRPADAKLELYDTATPKQSFDAPNPGTRMLGFTVRAGQGESVELVVVLRPAEERRLTGAERRFTTTPPIEWQAH